jgi:SPP1 gp7 family putative phage head morphogenesis protein
MQAPSWWPFQKKEQPVEEKKPVVVGGTEISLRDPQMYPKGLVQYPYNEDIFVQRKGGLHIYDKMRRDEQVKACQWLKRLSVLCSGWTVESSSDENQDIEVADFCTEVFKRLKGTLEERVKQILTAMDFGFSVTEKIWGLISDGDFRGKIGLIELKTRKPHRWDFLTDAHGNLMPMGLWQMNGQYKYDQAKFVIYSHQKEFDNWYGRSDLQEAYRPWWSKDIIIRFWNIFLERYGMGIPFLHANEGRTLTDPDYTDLKNAIFNLQAGSALATKSDNALIDILESTRRGTGEYEKAVTYYDRAIGKALLMPSGLGFSEDTKSGSYARSQTHFDLWLWIMMDLRKITEETIINEQIIRELVDYNYTVKKYPQFKLLPLEQDEKSELAKLWLQAIEGRAVHPDAEDELHFRRLIKFPEQEEDELKEKYEIELNKRPSGLPPSWPGMGWELQKTQIDESGNPIDDEKNGKGQQPFPPNKQEIPPQKPKEEKETKHEHYAKIWHRELTKYEKRVDFGKIEKELDRLEDDTRVRLREILTKQRNKLVKTIEKATINMNWINALGLQYGIEFQAIVRDFMRTGFEMGRGHAREVIAKAKQRANFQIVKMPPKQTIQMLEKSAFWIKNVTFQGLVKQVQGLLINALETGESIAETMQKIESVYLPYVGDTQIIRDQEQIEPYRIETLIRTNGTKAYSQGQMVEYKDPELEGFVRAIQLSAILDTRTTSICRNADQTIIMLDDPILPRMTPPLHHQCRTVPVPITVIDGEFEPSKQTVLHGVLELAPADFGGNVDK